MPVSQLLLIRHGEVEGAYQNVFGGRVDMELSPRGHEQASKLAELLGGQKLGAIYASPMKRVQQTLVPLLKEYPGLTPVILPDLREVDFGDWTGLNFAQVRARFNLSASSWIDELVRGRIQNAENFSNYHNRVANCVREILTNSPAGKTAVLCHGGVIRMMLAVLLALPFQKTAAFRIDYASVTQILVNPRLEIQQLNVMPWKDPAL